MTTGMAEGQDHSNNPNTKTKPAAMTINKNYS